MEGGVAILLLLIIGVLVIGGGAMLLGGGALGSSKSEGDDEGHRPVHKQPTDPVQENREFAGVHHDDERQR
jgi:hypothetical protein